jgi:hypothetical protein
MPTCAWPRSWKWCARTRRSRAVYLHRSGLQLWPGRAARGQAPAGRCSAPMWQVVGDELHPMRPGEGLCTLRRQDQGQRRARPWSLATSATISRCWSRPRARSGFDGKLLHLLWQRTRRSCCHRRCRHVGKVVAVADWLPNVPGARKRGVLPVVPRHAFPSRRMTMCTCACSSWWRRWPSPSSKAGSDRRGAPVARADVEKRQRVNWRGQGGSHARRGPPVSASPWPWA